jgi:hypothetical protein
MFAGAPLWDSERRRRRRRKVYSESKEGEVCFIQNFRRW